MNVSSIFGNYHSFLCLHFQNVFVCFSSLRFRCRFDYFILSFSSFFFISRNHFVLRKFSSISFAFSFNYRCSEDVLENTMFVIECQGRHTIKIAEMQKVEILFAQKSSMFCNNLFARTHYNSVENSCSRTRSIVRGRNAFWWFFMVSEIGTLQNVIVR